MSTNNEVFIIRTGKSKVHSAKEELGVLMNHETVVSAPWHCMEMDKEAARHAWTVSLRKGTSTPTGKSQLEECSCHRTNVD